MNFAMMCDSVYILYIVLSYMDVSHISYAAVVQSFLCASLMLLVRDRAAVGYRVTFNT